MFGIEPWFERQLKPLVKHLWNVHPDVLSWSALAISLCAGALLWGACDTPWMAVAAVPLLMGRLALNSLDAMVAKEKAGTRVGSEVINELSDRLCDLAIFLSLAFWTDMKVRLVLLAIIAMLMVSYVGVLGKAAGAERVSNGLLGKGERMALLIFSCLVYGIAPDLRICGFSVFESMFVLFLPLSSITLLQRLDRIFNKLSGSKNPPE